MDSTNTGLRELLPQLTPDTARELARESDAEGDALKRRARALFAYADALDGGLTERIEDERPTVAPPPGTTTDAAWPPASPLGQANTTAPPSDKKPLIADLVSGSPMPGWTPTRVHTALVERDLIPPETTKASIGVTMRRMYTQYEMLAKTPDGLYTTPEHGEMHIDSTGPDGEVDVDTGELERPVIVREPDSGLRPFGSAIGSGASR